MDIAEEISQTNSVSIHIRRGDYLLENGAIEMGYYSKAIRKLEQIEELSEDEFDFYVFSDDERFAKEIFGKIKNYHIIDGNTGNKSYRDMQLMSLWKHNIVANSTFSFWGAYLNKNSDKVVIAPSIPFGGS